MIKSGGQVIIILGKIINNIWTAYSIQICLIRPVIYNDFCHMLPKELFLKWVKGCGGRKQFVSGTEKFVMACYPVTMPESK